MLQDSGTIDLSATPTRNLSIRADVDSVPGSVAFTLDGTVYHTENVIPFAIGGHSNTTYFAWTPAAGSHSLLATPYSGTNGTGTPGTALSISFDITDDYSHRLGSLTIKAAPGVPVTIEQTRHDFIFGCMLNIDGFNGSMSAADEASYRATFLSNFNYSVHGNAMKWYSTEPDWWKPSHPTSPPRWQNADLMLDWCESNSIPMRGHTLFWGANHSTANGGAWTPDWVEALSNTDLLNAVMTRATNITERFAGRITEFDFNNEMMHGNFYKDRLGWGGVSNMAAWAKQGNSNCTLYVNDYNVLNGNASAYVSHINTLLAQGVAIDGIGCQGHFSSSINQNDITAKLDTLSTLGLPIKVTEFDLNSTNESTKESGLEALYRACFAHNNVNGIIQWGFWEGKHWRPNAALWTTNWIPTPAANKYRDLVFREWWTTAGGDVPSEGTYPFRAFLGTYTVTIDGIEQTVKITPQQSNIVLTYDGSSVSTNYPITVAAGGDVTLVRPTLSANLNGIINDPSAGSPTSLWSQVSGPGTVIFGTPSSTNTSVTLPDTLGSYIVRFHAGDGFTEDSDQLTITLEPSAAVFDDFDDDFANGVVADSKSQSAYWSTATSINAGDANALVESGGILTLSAGSNDGGDDGAFSGTAMYSAITSSFNFFSHARTLSARGITFDDHGTAVIDSSEQLRLCFLSGSNNSYGADDAIIVKVTPDGKIRLGEKENDPNNNSDGTSVHEFTGLGISGIYGFDLTLRQINATTVEYRFEAYTGAVPVSAGVAVGSFGLTAANWGSGDSLLSLWAQEYNVTGGNQYFDAAITNLSVQTDGNLLYNAGFELGNTSGWQPFTATTLSMESGTVYDGSYACRVSGRTASWHSIRRYVDAVMSTGETYTVSIWARLGSGADDSANLTIKVVDSGGDHYSPVATETLTSTSWTKLQGQYTYGYTGTLSEAFFYISGVASGIDILVDEASVELYVPPPPAGTIFFFQ